MRKIREYRLTCKGIAKDEWAFVLEQMETAHKDDDNDDDAIVIEREVLSSGLVEFTTALTSNELYMLLDRSLWGEDYQLEELI